MSKLERSREGVVRSGSFRKWLTAALCLLLLAASSMARADDDDDDEPVPPPAAYVQPTWPVQAQPAPSAYYPAAPQPTFGPGSQCTTKTVTTTTCTGDAAPYAVPGAVPPPPGPPPGPPAAQPPAPQAPQLTLPYYYGGPVWAERVVEHKERRWGLFITGLSTFVLSYTSSALIGAAAGSTELEPMKYPLFGPFWAAANVGHDDGCDSDCGGTAFVQTVLVIDGLAQIAGVAMAIAGPLSFSIEREHKKVRIALGPGPGLVGMAATTRF